MLTKALSTVFSWARPRAAQTRPPGLRVALNLTPAQVIAIHSLLSTARRRVAIDSSVQPMAVEAARGVLTPEQRLKLDQLAATAKEHPVVEEAIHYNLLSTAYERR